MVLGLKRGVVELADHDPEWEQIARETIGRLWRVFGAAAKDIQHVGSTAIIHIKAKPIIDIAVAVDDFAEVEKLIPALESEDFVWRKWENSQRMLFAIGDYVNPDGLVTHFIHVMKSDSEEWFKCIGFRDYLNANISAAKEYEALKIKLAGENPIDPGREKYVAGKDGFITKTLADAHIWVLLRDIPGYDTFVKIEPVEKGWSSDKKYYIETAADEKLLLRVADIIEYERKKKEIDVMKRISALGINMSQPIDFGICNGGKNVYTLLTWCEGKEAKVILPMLTETEQYVIGLKAGEILKRIHTIETYPESSDWVKSYSAKIDNYIEKYKNCGMTFDGDKLMLNHVEQNRHLLENRPTCLTHGDFHVGNLVISPEKDLYVIDFQRYRIIDAYCALMSIMFSADVSPHFATGQLRGYFDGEPPEDFWELLAFYLAAVSINSIPWSIPFGQEEIDFSYKMIENILHWFDNMKNPVPTWYLKDFHVQWIDDIPYKLKEPFDFSFLGKYGKVFKVFDEQSSGCICFGVSDGEHKYFIKFAGVKTINNHDLPVSDAIARLKAAVIKYKELEHPLLIRLIEAKETGNGYMLVFDWYDGEGFSIETPALYEKFKALPIDKKIYVFEEILRFHEYAAQCGYVAMDFNDYSTLYDFDIGQIKICDIDFYAKQSYINGFGRALGDTVVMSPEEFRIGGLIDEISNVYTMGATAFRLFSEHESDRSPETWPLNRALYDVVKKAVSDERDKRQQSITQLIAEWGSAK